MSWSFTVVADTQTEAKEKVRKWREKYNCLPGAIEAAILGLIDALPASQPGGPRVFVRSHGHIDQYSNGRNGALLIEVTTTGQEQT